MNKLLALVVILMLATSCGNQRKASKSSHPAKDSTNVVDDINHLRMQINAAAPQYKWLRSRGDVQYEKDKQSISARVSFKQRQDSLVWVSLNVMIEAARAMATKDSAYILNRLSKEYSIVPISGLETMFGIPGLDLLAVQNLLLAYPPFGIAEGAKFNTDSSGYNIERKTATFLEKFHINASTMRLDKYHLEQNATHQITVTYSDFKQVGQMQLPGKIEMSVRSPDKILITLNIADYTLLDTDEAPFSIPSSFSRIH